MCKYNKYDVIFAELPSNKGSTQAGRRPCVVVQNSLGNQYSPTLIVLPLTKKIKNLDQATHLLVKKDEENGLHHDSMLLAEQVATVDKSTAKKIGRISNRTMQKDIFKCYIYAAAYGDQDEDLRELVIK